VLAVALAVGLATPRGAEAASPSARALDYLRGAQNSDGGFGAAGGQGSTQLHSGWVALGLAAADRNPRAFQRGGASPVDYIRGGLGSLRDTGELERTILVVRASGLSPRDFGGRDLIADLQSKRRSDGSYGTVNWTAFAILSLRASGVGISGRSVSYLAKQQNSDGGYGFSPAAASDADDTGTVLQALAAAGKRRSSTARRAVAYLKRTQHSDGGWGQMPSQPSNAQSTAWAVQGLVAAGRNPASIRRGGRSPIAYLQSLQRSDGSFRYSRSSSQTPVWVTAQALVALERKAFPLRAVAMPARASSGGSESRAERKREERAAAEKARQKGDDASDAGSSPEAGSAPAPGTPAAPGSPTSAPAAAADGDSDRGTVWALAIFTAAALAAIAVSWWRRRRGMRVL
jgi:hypothetical protein